jgi:hypothetical protein
MAVSQTEYGRFDVTSNTKTTGFGSNTTYWGIETRNEPTITIGNGKEGKQQARTLAAVLNAAGAHGFDMLPPGMVENDELPGKGSSNEWEQWAADTEAVPARIATAGKAAVAGWLKVVHRERESWIGTELDVSESTVRQYLSDLREGRR